MNIDYPYQFNTLGQTAHTTDEDHIRDMIEQFLFTNIGERVNRPEFGSGLMQLVFTPNSPELASTLQFTVQAGLVQWLGDVIDVQSLDVTSEDSLLRVEVVYSILNLGETITTTFERSDV